MAILVATVRVKDHEKNSNNTQQVSSQQWNLLVESC